MAITAEPQGYTYDKPQSNNDGLSVSLLLPPSQNQQIPTSFPVSLYEKCKKVFVQQV